MKNKFYVEARTPEDFFAYVEKVKALHKAKECFCQKEEEQTEEAQTEAEADAEWDEHWAELDAEREENQNRKLDD